jgi:hypothetical protein
VTIIVLIHMVLNYLNTYCNPNPKFCIWAFSWALGFYQEWS